MPPVTESRRWQRVRIAAIGALIVLIGAREVLVSRAWNRARLERAILAERFTSGRLFGQRRSMTGSAERLNRLTLESRDWLASDSSPRTLRTGALLEARWAAVNPSSLDRAVAGLERARAAAPRDVPILNDAAVLDLEIAERDQRIEPLLRALDAIERAVATDSSATAVLFNRALILERLYLKASAESAWSRFIAVEHDSAWAAEASTHLAALHASLVTSPWNGPLDSLLTLDSTALRREVERRVRQMPQTAREMGFTILEQWGRAVETNNTPRARRLLNLVQCIGEASKALGVDQSIALGVAAIERQAGNASALRVVASGYVALGQGVELFGRSSFDSSQVRLSAAEQTLRTMGSPMARWARFYLAAALVSLNRYDDGDGLLLSLLHEATPGEPALIGKTMLALGVSQGRRGNYERANEWYRRGAKTIAAAHEPENDAYAGYLLSEGLRFAGQAIDSRTAAFAALRGLAPYRTSNYLNNHLAAVQSDARSMGLTYAALALGREVIEVSRGIAKPEVVALALAARAYDLANAGRAAEADVALSAAERSLARMPPEKGLSRIRASILLSRGVIMLPRDPRAALPVLERAADAFTEFTNDLFLPTALHAAARAAMASGDRTAALRWLGSAMDAIERQTKAFRAADERAAFAETAEQIFDSMIGIELDEGNPGGAFSSLERNREAVWSPASLGGTAPAISGAAFGLDTIAASIQNDGVFVAYALLQDRVAIWSATRGAWRESSVPVSRDTVAALVARLNDELDVETATPRSVRALLFDLLLRPLARELAEAHHITIVPDRELFGVPFAALWDRESQRYLIETHEVRMAPSAAFYMQAAKQRRRTDLHEGARQVLVVGDPTGDRESRRLAPLPSATIEAQGVASLYPGATLLTGGAAAPADVMRQLKSASVFHFAGHAVFDEDRPEHSFLVLASTGDATGELTAREIATLRTSKLKLVVLSACSTLNPRPTRSGAVRGLAFTFLRAGASGIVSSLWEVRDDATAELLLNFHRHLATSASPAEALKEAQLAALRSSRGSLRVPRAWAAFTYTGS